MLESLYVSNNYCGVYDVEGTGHLKSDSSVIGDSKVADIIFVSLTALKYHYVMLLFTSPDNINIWNMNKFSMFFICYECMVSFYLLAGIFYPLQKKKTSTILEVWNCYYWIPINMYALSFIGKKNWEMKKWSWYSKQYPPQEFRLNPAEKKFYYQKESCNKGETIS